jgi:hypothetical protein
MRHTKHETQNTWPLKHGELQTYSNDGNQAHTKMTIINQVHKE